MPGEQSTYDSIIIAGVRFKLGSGVRVVTWEDPEGYSFPREKPAAEAKSGSSVFGNRHSEKSQKVTDMAGLKATVHQVVLHADLTRDSLKCFKVLLDRGLSTHFMIDWDGTIYQGLDVLFQAYHAGDANNGSIGVDVNNMMRNLVREPDAGAYNKDHPRFAEMSKREFKRPRWPGARINGAAVKSFGYTDPQYTALIELLKILTKELDRIQPFPPLDAKGDIIPNALEGATEFEGFLGHYHLTTGRWDPGPAFDWQRVYHGLAREHNSFPIEMEPGKNISTLLEPAKVKAYAERYFRGIEASSGGGWYPVGINQTWHGGVHVPAKVREPVYAMFDGVVVAGRFGKKPTAMGHNNFLLLRHEIEVPQAKKEKTETLVFYSLYMHLQPIDIEDAKKPDHPEWVKALYRVDSGVDAEEEEALAGDGGEDGDGGGDGLGDDEFDELGEEDDDAEFDSRPYLEVGQRIAAFKRGDIALVGWEENPVKVSSGEQIGAAGEFGPAFEWSPMVHVEVFADRGWKEAVDLGVHGRYLVEIEPDLGNDLFVSDRNLLTLFGVRIDRPVRGSMVPARVVDPDDIEYFFTSSDFKAEKEWLRKVVARHVSEWSDKVDWVAALSAAEDWDDRVKDFKKILKRSGIFRDAIEKTLPFIWLNKQVAEHIGLDVEEWDGVLYHFHPIHFLMWLTYHSSQRIRTLSKGKTLAQVKAEMRKEHKKIQRLKKLGKYKEEDQDACQLAAMDLEDVEFGDASEVLQDLFEEGDQGEWDRPDLEGG